MNCGWKFPVILFNRVKIFLLIKAFYKACKLISKLCLALKYSWKLTKKPLLGFYINRKYWLKKKYFIGKSEKEN